MASQMSHALSDIKSYDPGFRVDIRLHEPLWKDYLSDEEISVEILALCSQLEALCKERYTKSSGGISSEHKKEYFTRFEPLANVIVGKMQEYLNFMPNPRPSLKEYFKRSGLVTLFPKSASYIINHKRPSFKNQKSTMDGYFTHLSMLNQLLCLGNQLNSDVNNLDNHKYIAHQIALLYQAVNQVAPSLSHVKKEIEENFISIKESLSSQDKDSSPKLPRTHKEWVNSMTGDLLNNLVSLHLPIMQPLQPAVQFLRQSVQSCQ